MFGIGTWELVVILILALIVFGPTKLPEIAKSLGKALASLRRSAEQVKKDIDLEGLQKEIAENVEVDELKRLVDVRGEVRRALSDLDDHPALPGPPESEALPTDRGSSKDEP